MQDRKIMVICKISTILSTTNDWLITMNVYYQCTKPENCHRNQIFAAGTKIKIQYETTLMETDTHAIKNNGGFYLLKMYRYIQIKILIIW